METKRIYISTSQPGREALAEAARILRDGGLVAFPTETVYGLGANAVDAAACAQIFRVKGRPQDNPLIVHVSGKAEALPLIREWSEAAELCARKFWPGPLTLVLPKSSVIPDEVTAGLDTVAIRVPSHPVALALIEETGLPVAAPSANLSGRPSPTSGAHVWQDLRGAVPLILDAGSTQVGLESTVLDLSAGIPTILRPGGVTREQLERLLGQVSVDKPSSDRPPKAPGMKYRHYAPKGDLQVIGGVREKGLERMAEEIAKAHRRNKKVGVLCTLESAPVLHAQLPDLLFVLGSEGRPEEMASNLFEGLRLCDSQEIEVILAEGTEESGIGVAVMNRLKKAAGQKVIPISPAQG
ncbi:DHBP synthase RibB-like alpha/beta domain protein [Acididesulfobacillus acetoxydans]|uniref:Threonylcarbamoyl-AMP synthase n=1 Tax=Acididesulfobacillus acetoxydans TaxID=1561005 RepID=A0A8S0WL05_9FIRM|nr:L-threonylcarbamoyladenylate synthase [Acididesulfobacillus acetoxydans]CAA7599744.1 DHBP synthase RibB-like alpha/beta domain protein [Acididesulfobacillus acetoxydans]CEJ06295.1 tRNA threonylcarbamoyladenosine biosynthesis protein sua5 [Acididesulfobacillus acetoxydans]